MRVLSVNRGRERTHMKKMEPEVTGIYKVPADGRVSIGPTGIPDDFIGDLKNHGGPDQAVYVYGTPDYAWWAKELGRELSPGTFGENLTVTELESAGLRIGDQLQVSGVLLEVTAPRIPCSTLAARMGDIAFSKKFQTAERPGLYCRVLARGEVQAGDEVTHVPYPGERVTILEMFRNKYNRTKDEARLRRLLSVPISVRARIGLERDLKAALEAANL